MAISIDDGFDLGSYDVFGGLIDRSFDLFSSLLGGGPADFGGGPFEFGEAFDLRPVQPAGGGGIFSDLLRGLLRDEDGGFGGGTLGGMLVVSANLLGGMLGGGLNGALGGGHGGWGGGWNGGGGHAAGDGGYAGWRAPHPGHAPSWSLTIDWGGHGGLR